jgi:hypothetical protein
LQFILRSIIAKETTMVLRMTGASWLASMMRSERAPDERPAPAPAWLLDGAIEPEGIALLPRDAGELSRSD